MPDLFNLLVIAPLFSNFNLKHGDGDKLHYSTAYMTVICSFPAIINVKCQFLQYNKQTGR